MTSFLVKKRGIELRHLREGAHLHDNVQRQLALKALPPRGGSDAEVMRQIVATTVRVKANDVLFQMGAVAGIVAWYLKRYATVLTEGKRRRCDLRGELEDTVGSVEATSAFGPEADARPDNHEQLS